MLYFACTTWGVQWKWKCVDFT